MNQTLHIVEVKEKTPPDTDMSDQGTDGVVLIVR